jgi:hypothetical protein
MLAGALGANCMNLNLQLFLLVLLFGCSSPRNEELKSNSTINSIFNERETHDLIIINDFFYNQICENSPQGNEPLDKCYAQFLENMSESYRSGIFDLDIPFDKQLDLYENISDSTFNNLWKFNKCTFPDFPGTLKCINYNFNGKIVQLLKELSKEYPAMKEYYETFLMAGGIAPTMVMNVAVYYDKYDIDDVRIKLVIALHYLTLNDKYERREKIKSAPNNGEHP